MVARKWHMLLRRHITLTGINFTSCKATAEEPGFLTLLISPIIISTIRRGNGSLPASRR